MGAAISPRSSVNGRQFDIGIMIWKVIFFFKKIIPVIFIFFHFFFQLKSILAVLHFPHPPKNV